MFALGQEVEPDIEIKGRPGLSIEEIDVGVMKNAVPMMIGAVVAFYVIYRMLGRY
jgi:hypothetical protein